MEMEQPHLFFITNNRIRTYSMSGRISNSFFILCPRPLRQPGLGRTADQVQVLGIVLGLIPTSLAGLFADVLLHY